jgi:AcrR family transcriptional regulator
MMQGEQLTKAEKTRRMIVKKAARLFNKQGYAGTSMKDIMEATGLTKGGLYGNFESKEAIAKAAFDYSVFTVGKEVGRRTKVISNTLDKLKAVVYYYKENLFTPAIDGGCPIQNTAVEADDNNPIMREKVIKALDFWQARMIATLEKGKIRKEVRPGVVSADFASLFISTLEGGILIARLYKNPKHFDRVADQLVNMIEEARL